MSGFGDPGRVKVPPELAGGGTHLRGISQNLVDLLLTLRAKVTALGDTWQGQLAHNSYVNYQTEWDRSAADLFGGSYSGATGVGADLPNDAAASSGQGILPTMAAAMDRINMNYGDAEATNARGWQH